MFVIDQKLPSCLQVMTFWRDRTSPFVKFPHWVYFAAFAAFQKFKCTPSYIIIHLIFFLIPSIQHLLQHRLFFPNFLFDPQRLLLATLLKFCLLLQHVIVKYLIVMRATQLFSLWYCVPLPMTALIHLSKLYFLIPSACFSSPSYASLHLLSTAYRFPFHEKQSSLIENVKWLEIVCL